MRCANAQPADQLTQAALGQRRVLVHHHIDQRVDGRLRISVRHVIGPGGIQPHAAFAPGNAQQAAAVHAVQQLGADVGGSAKPIPRFAVRKLHVHIARMHHPALAHKGQHGSGLLMARIGPGLARCARVHPRLGGAGQEAVVDEEVFLDLELGVTRLQIAGPVILDAVVQRQVLDPGRRANRIGLCTKPSLRMATDKVVGANSVRATA